MFSKGINSFLPSKVFRHIQISNQFNAISVSKSYFFSLYASVYFFTSSNLTLLMLPET